MSRDAEAAVDRSTQAQRRTLGEQKTFRATSGPTHCCNVPNACRDWSNSTTAARRSPKFPQATPRAALIAIVSGRIQLDEVETALQKLPAADRLKATSQYADKSSAALAGVEQRQQARFTKEAARPSIELSTSPWVGAQRRCRRRSQAIRTHPAVLRRHLRRPGRFAHGSRSASSER